MRQYRTALITRIYSGVSDLQQSKKTQNLQSWGTRLHVIQCDVDSHKQTVIPSRKSIGPHFIGMENRHTNMELYSMTGNYASFEYGVPSYWKTKYGE